MKNIGELIDTAWQARREGRYGDAEQDLQRAIEESRESGRRPELIRALKALAHVVRDQGQGERALPLSEEAVSLAREDGDALVLAHTVRHLGDLHRESGRTAEAKVCYEEAIALYRGSSDRHPLDVANALRPAAILEEEQGNPEAARQLWLEARRLYQMAGVQAGVDEAEHRLNQPS